ncbi:MAG TPA: branched-chain amino acid ABC transporter substrate-binding protein [Candidatus Mailhella merdavium]|nr:branched-chain amino acid ABC transporter substrate-binding protein [Candidatus Mailhella merdavium]
MSKRWLQTLACGMVALFAATPAFAAETLKLGVAGAHSGELASYGTPSLNAAILVADEFNAKGGVLGRQVEIVAQDDLCKAEVATAAATKLISDGVAAVMGHICSGPCKATLPLYTNAHMISMSPSATTPALTQSGENPTFFRTIANDNDSAIVGAKFIVEGLKLDKVAILHDNSEYGRGYAEKAKEELEKSGKTQVVLFEAVTPGATDYSSAVRKVGQSKAQALMWGGYYPEAAKILSNMYTAGLEIPMIGPDGLKDMGFVQLAGEDAEGVYASGPTDTSANPLSIYYAKKHQEKFGTAPGAFFDNGVAATIALLNAINVAQSTDTDKIMEALRNTEVDTPIGRIKFDEKGDAIGVGMSIYKIEGGQYKEVFKN